jgi:hypothetical protein
MSIPDFPIFGQIGNRGFPDSRFWPNRESPIPGQIGNRGDGNWGFCLCSGLVSCVVRELVPVVHASTATMPRQPRRNFPNQKLSFGPTIFRCVVSPADTKPGPVPASPSPGRSRRHTSKIVARGPGLRPAVPTQLKMSRAARVWVGRKIQLAARFLLSLARPQSQPVRDEQPGPVARPRGPSNLKSPRPLSKHSL